MSLPKLSIYAVALFLVGINAPRAEQTQTETAGEQVKNVEKAIKHHRHTRRLERRLKKVDTNEDGKIDLNEYLANAEQRFSQLDLNSDGYVTLEEHKEAGKVMREKHREMRAKHRQLREQMKQEREAASEESKGG